MHVKLKSLLDIIERDKIIRTKREEIFKKNEQNQNLYIKNANLLNENHMIQKGKEGKENQ